MIRKKRWLTFFLSWIPGLGHLYLGLAKQGVQLMVGASVCIILIPAMPLIFPFALAILWFYQLFDALQKVNWMRAVAAEHERMMMGQESFGYPWTERDWVAMGGYQRENAISPYWLGGVCIIIGFMVILTTVFPAFWDFIFHKNAGSVILALGLIGYGLWLFFKKPGHRSEHL